MNLRWIRVQEEEKGLQCRNMLLIDDLLADYNLALICVANRLKCTAQKEF